MDGSNSFGHGASANMGLNESGGAVLRWTIFRIFELWCFVESAVLNRPAFVKPRTVSCKRITTRQQQQKMTVKQRRKK